MMVSVVARLLRFDRWWLYESSLDNNRTVVYSYKSQRGKKRNHAIEPWIFCSPVCQLHRWSANAWLQRGRSKAAANLLNMRRSRLLGDLGPGTINRFICKKWLIGGRFRELHRSKIITVYRSNTCIQNECVLSKRRHRPPSPSIEWKNDPSWGHSGVTRPISWT